MIIDQTYFKGNIYLPHATPSITDSVVDVQSELDEFIREFEFEALVKIFGSTMAYELIDQIDVTRPNLLKQSASPDWDALLNGEKYTDIDGKEKVWPGLRYKTFEGASYNRSLLAYYVYFFYESNDHITRGDIGNQVEKGANSERVTPRYKVVKAWNKFIDLVGFKGAYSPTFIERTMFARNRNCSSILGIDWYGGKQNEPVTLYGYIADKKKVNELIFPNFEKGHEVKINIYDF